MSERFAGTLRCQCLDHLLIYEQRHLRKVLTDHESHYNAHRRHQDRALRPPLHDPGRVVDLTTQIQRRTVLNGLLRPQGCSNSSGGASAWYMLHRATPPE